MPSYLFCFEVNKNNIGTICSKIPHTKSWTGFDWTSGNYIVSGTCGSVNKNTTFPIKAFQNPYSSPQTIDKTDYVITRNDLDIKDINSFFLWDEVVGMSNFSYSCQCPSFTTNDNVNQTMQVELSSGKKGKTLSFTAGCEGTICQTWWPPSNYPYPKTIWDMSNNGTHQIGCYSGNMSNRPVFSSIVNDGEVSYSFPLYKPISYTNLPETNKNNVYVPNPSIKGAFYNCSPFLGQLELVNDNMGNPGTVNGVCGCETVPPSEPNSYAIYEVRYDINVNSFKQPSFYNNLNDFLYLQQYIYLNSTPSFLKSTYWTTTTENIKQLVIDYCNNSGYMTQNLCSGLFTSFSLLFPKGSPCINPYSNCTKGWGDYCYTEDNFYTPLCLNYYSNSYIASSMPNNPNLLLGDNVVNGLQKTCQNIFSNVENPVTDLSQQYWNICSCFLPQQYYENYLKENNLENKSIGSQECWYLPCANASVVPQSNPTCPNNSVTNCIQNAYITIKTDNPANIQNDVIQTQQTITGCGTASSAEPINTVSSTVLNPTSTEDDTMFLSPIPMESSDTLNEFTIPPSDIAIPTISPQGQPQEETTISSQKIQSSEKNPNMKTSSSGEKSKTKTLKGSTTSSTNNEENITTAIPESSLSIIKIVYIVLFIVGIGAVICIVSVGVKTYIKNKNSNTSYRKL